LTLTINGHVYVGSQASGWFASPSGSAGGAGTIGSPWDLATALAGGTGGTAIQPGDTLYLRGGTYTGHFTSTLTGTSGSHIKVMPYGRGTGSRERVTIDCYNAGNADPGFNIQGAYTDYYDIECYTSNVTRTTATPGSTPPNGCNNGFAFDPNTPPNDIRCINFVVHDTAQGPFFTRVAHNVEVYGLLAYYNGWDGPDRGHGHALYFQNDLGYTKKATNCICHNCFDLGVQSFGSNSINDLTLDQVTIFDSGRISSFGTQPNWNMGAGGSGGGYNLSVNDSDSYSTTNTYDNLTYTDGWHNWSVTNGHWYNSFSFTAAWLYGTIVCNGNIFPWDGGQSAYGTNSYAGRPASGKTILVRPNAHETGRGNIIVFNWDLSSTVSVDVSTVGLQNGDSYEVRHSMDFYGTAVASGTYNGSNITIPMTGLPIATPINFTAPGGPFPEFAAFTIWKM
jgi:hypothetical protein